MKILWLINITLPSIAKIIQTSQSNIGGWLIGFFNALLREEDIILMVCFPYDGIESIEGETNKLAYHGFVQRINDPTIYNEGLEDEFIKVINRYKPDIIHIWGTEYPHTLAMVKAAKKVGMIDIVIISIQGLCSIISKHYLKGIPCLIQKRRTLRDIIRNDDLNKQRDNFTKRGKFEIEALQNVKHVIGRTTWDKACITQINPNAEYHFCNEILRNLFYENKWDINTCKKYSIFMSQAYYPIKGLHFMLEAMPLILNGFPKTHLYIGGWNITRNTSLEDKIRLSSYGKWMISLINEHKLSDHITFIGEMNEELMVEQFLKAHVFVLPSSIENSPNSLGEAMLLGVPAVCSNVGGVYDLLVHNSEGFTYQYDAPYMLAYYICQLFDNDELAINISNSARKHAFRIYSKEINSSNLIKIYKEIGN